MQTKSMRSGNFSACIRHSSNQIDQRPSSFVRDRVELQHPFKQERWDNLTHVD
jgi:hypothetical protein